MKEPQKLLRFEKKMLSVFVVVKRSRKICSFRKDTVIRSLIPLEIKYQTFIKVTVSLMWNALLPTTEDCVDVASLEVITEELILRTEYMVRRRTSVAVYKVPPRLIGERLPMAKY